MKPNHRETAEELARRISTQIRERIMHVDVQQFLANTLVALRVQRETGRRCRLRHAFPYAPSIVTPGAERSKVLTPTDLQGALLSTAEAVGKEVSEFVAPIEQELDRFVGTIELVQGRNVFAGTHDVRPAIEEITRVHKPLFNFLARPGRVEDVREILRREGVRVVEMPGLELFSACVSQPDDGGETVIYLREDIPDCLKTFLLGHELGHWWLHLGRGERLENKPGDTPVQEFYLHSAHAWGSYEQEADAVALVAVLPSPYLSRCEVEQGKLDEQEILDHLTPEALTKPMQDHFLLAIRRRIQSYHHYKAHLETMVQGVRLTDRDITVDAAEGICRHLEYLKTRWARLEAGPATSPDAPRPHRVVACGQAWAALFGMTPAEIVSRNLDIIEDLTPDTTAGIRAQVTTQLRNKERRRRSYLYWAAYKHPDKPSDTEETIHVILTAYPIFDKDEYVGTIGIAVPYPTPAGVGHVRLWKTATPMSGHEGSEQLGENPTIKPGWIDECRRTFEKELPRLRAQYPGLLVAVSGRQILETDTSAARLISRYCNTGPPAEFFRIPVEDDSDRLELTAPDGQI